MTLAGDRATFDFLDADGDSAMTVLGLERRSPEDWLRYTPPKNIDGYRCERAGFDVAGFDLPGVLDGPGGAPAIAHVVAAESSDTPLIVAECSMDGDIVFLHTVTARSDGAEVGHAVFQRVPDGAPSPG